MALPQRSIGKSRHRMVLFQTGAKAEARGGKRAEAGVLTLNVPLEIEIELDADQAHDLSIGLAVEIGDRFYRVESVEVEDLMPADNDGRIEIGVIPSDDLRPDAIGLSFER